jgi:hypothetical protein
MKALVQVVVLAALVMGSVMLYRRGQPVPAALDAYQKVSLGMSQDQLQAILGRPNASGPVVIRNAACAGPSEAPAQARTDYLRGMLVSRADSAAASSASQGFADIIYEGSRGVVVIRDGAVTMAEESQAAAVWQGLESGTLALTSEGIFRQERTLEGVSAASSAKGVRNLSFGTLLRWPGADNQAIVVQLANGEVCFKSYLGPAGEAR